jgi:hypothetical protein
MDATVTFDGFEDVLTRAAREGARLALAEALPPSGWLNAKSAAAYLDMTGDALAGAIKRGQLVPHRSSTGRRLFTREQLDEFARGGDAC